MKASQRARAEDARRADADRVVRATTFDAVIITDPRGMITSLNPAAEEMLGYSASEVEGQGVGMLVGDVPVAGRHELSARRKDGSTIVVELRAVGAGPHSADGLVLVARDLTRVRDTESELRLSDGALSLLGAKLAGLRRIAGVVAKGAEPRSVFGLVAQEAAQMLGVERGAVIRFVGRTGATEVGTWPESDASGLRVRRRFGLRQDSAVRRVLRTGRSARVASVVGDAARPGCVAAPIHLDEALWGALSVSTTRADTLSIDTEQRLDRFADLIAPVVVEAEARASLERHAAEQRAISALGEQALRSEGVDALLADAVAIVARTLGAERVVVLELLHDEDQLMVRAQSAPGDPFLRIPLAAGTRFARTVEQEAPVVVVDARRGRRFAPSDRDPATRTSISVAIRLRSGCWGVLEASDRQPGRFGPSDPDFLQGVAHVLAAAVERWRTEDIIRHQAMHDPLTGLANRSVLGDRLTNALARSARARASVVVMALDLDHFKRVNEAHGRGGGDTLLAAVARRLEAAVRPGDTVARIEADEFALLCVDVADELEAGQIAERIVRSFDAPFDLGEEVSVTASVGVVLCGTHGAAEGALRDANTATHRAKTAGRNRFELFDESMRTRLIERRSLERDLHRAIEHDELVLHYQPIVSLPGHGIDGVEALVRWNHPERGLLAPGAFVPIAEETGQIVALGRKVLTYASRDAARWNELAVGAPLHVSVNLSALQVAEDDIVDVVLANLAAWGIPPGQMGLEITETVVLGDNPLHLERLAELRSAGLRIILDDFGTGYSSLSYLRRFPLDMLKLDRSFVTGLESDPGAIAVIAAVTQMAQALSLVVVAEGVERLAELRVLESLGCQLAQGYLFARPMSLEKVERLLASPLPWARPRRLADTDS